MRADERTARLLTLALAAVAGVLAVAACADESRAPLLDHASWLGLCGAVLFVQHWLQPRNALVPPPRWAYAVFAVVVSLPIASLAIDQGALAGLPLERLLLLLLRNLALALALLAAWPTCFRLSALSSLFLAAFGSCIADSPEVPYLLGAFAATGCLWLMAAAWRSLSETKVGERRIPWLAGVGIFLVVATVAGGTALGPRKLGAPIAEWVASSGGTSAYDPQSRRGVGDGEEEVASDNPTSIGFQVTDTFVESQGQSLYDAVSDMYGEGYKPRNKLERTIALSPNRVVNLGDKPPELRKPGREFQTIRTPTDRPSTGQMRHGPDKALLHVKGRLPLHIRLAAYDRFDGGQLHEAPPPDRTEFVVDRPYWFAPTPAVRPWTHPSLETHEVKIGALVAEALPTPALLRRFRMGKVDQSSFFTWAHEGIVGLRERTVPRGTGLLMESALVDPSAAAQIRLELAESTEADAATTSLAIDKLAKQWSKETPRGWGQVATIAERFRSEYVYDPAYAVPPETKDSVEHFLFVSQRGPDYLFATSAVLVLRSLGYSTRVATGLYLSAQSYASPTGHASAFAQDIHTWAEIRTESGDWLIVEATPGFDVLQPAPTWADQLRRAGPAGLAWLLAHLVELGVAALLGAALWAMRRRTLDFAATTWWWMGLRGEPRLAFLATMTLLERRAAWRGEPRRAHETPTRWLRRLGASEAFATGLEWAAFAPDGSPPPRITARAMTVCRATAQRWQLSAFGNVSRGKRR